MIKESIEIAIKAGWRYRGVKPKVIERGKELRFEMGGFTERVEEGIIWNDPRYWKFLAKGLGRSEKICEAFDGNEDITVRQFKGMPYMFIWHRFIDHLNFKKDPKTFFKSLLS